MPKTSLARFTSLSALLVALLMGGLLLHDFRLIDGDAIGKDATQNVRYSVNLARFGVYSGQAVSPEVVPEYRREPLPNFLLAGYLRGVDLFMPGYLDQVGQPFRDSFLLLIKRLNLVWALLLFLGLWATSQLVIAPLLAAHWLTCVQMLAVNHYFVAKVISEMDTELIAGATLVWLGAVLLQADRRTSVRWLFVAGVVFGLLALIKSSGAYVALVVLPLVAVLLSGVHKRFWALLLAVSLGFVLTVSPWVLRNQLQFAKPVIADGGGDVLLIRSVFNQMNGQQRRDALYAYAPRDMRRDLLGPLMHLSERDFACHGRLNVFNRKLECDVQALEQGRFDDVRSFYQRGGRALPRQYELDSGQKKALALQSFRQDPMALFAAAFPISWRGFWGFRVKEWPGIYWNLAAFSALLLAPVMACLERRRSWLLVSVVPLAYFLFYGLVSHFLPRYSSPFVPSALICLSMLTVDLVAQMSLRLWPVRRPWVRLR